MTCQQPTWPWRPGVSPSPWILGLSVSRLCSPGPSCGVSPPAEAEDPLSRMQTRPAALRPQPCNPRCSCGAGAAVSGSRRAWLSSRRGKGCRRLWKVPGWQTRPAAARRHPRRGRSPPYDVIGRVLCLWLRVFCKLGREEPGWQVLESGCGAPLAQWGAFHSKP